MGMTLADLGKRDGWFVLGEAAASRITDDHFGVVTIGDTCQWARHVLPSGQVASRGTGSLDECVTAVEQSVGAA